VFLGEDRWYAVRIHGSMRPQIKFAAAYQVAPVSAITHIAPVRSIEPWKDTGKVVLTFDRQPPRGTVRGLAFGGIHAVSPAIFDLTTERGAFSIVDEPDVLYRVWPTAEMPGYFANSTPSVSASSR
jgi:hypothetical protein